MRFSRGLSASSSCTRSTTRCMPISSTGTAWIFTGSTSATILTGWMSTRSRRASCTHGSSSKPDASLNVKRVLAARCDRGSGGRTGHHGAAHGGMPLCARRRKPLPSGRRTSAPCRYRQADRDRDRRGELLGPVHYAKLHGGHPEALRATVLGLSSNGNTPAKIDLQGQVDPFSPVSINGEVNVLSAALHRHRDELPQYLRWPPSIPIRANSPATTSPRAS